MSFSGEENRVFQALYDEADKDGVGVLTGDKAVSFFAKSNLNIEQLGEIWQIADAENNGFLTPERFKVALRLIGHAQQGEDVSAALSDKPGPMPVLSGSTSQAKAPPAIAIPKVSVEDKTKFLRMFLSSSPSNGLLDGDKAKDIFLKSNLPVTQLGGIWTLADTKNRGALDATDFIIGMHFIQLAMENALPSSGVPNSLPPGLYDSALVAAPAVPPPAAGQPRSATSSPIPAQRTGNALINKPSGILKPQNTGDRLLAKQHTGNKVAFNPTTSISVPSSPALSAFARPANTIPWDITAAEKARADGFFDSLDIQRRGFIEGEQAVPFFVESKLPESTLAQIWDLSDIKTEGRLTKDEFAVAMRLINDQLDGKPVPSSLPISLIPVYLRPNAASTAPAASAFRQRLSFFTSLVTLSHTSEAPVPSGPAQDLFSLIDDQEETLSSPATGSITQTAFSAPSSFADRAISLSPQSTGTPLQAPRSFSPSPASAPAPARIAAQPQQQQFATRNGALDDFLGDNSDKISNDSAQLGQLRNEHNASQRGVTTLQTQRKELEESAASVTAEVEELREKLKVSRATFESEQKVVNDLSIKAGDHKKELQKAKEELIRAESELSALKDEKREWEGSTMRDKEEIRGLKTKLADLAKETGTLKIDLEKLKKEGRQQKGMLAISKKQVTTAEGDRDRLSSEIDSSRTEASHPLVDQAAATALPESISSTPSVLSPATSVRSTNPFDRFRGASVEAPRSNTTMAAAFGLGAASAGAAGIAAHEVESVTAHKADPFESSETPHIAQDTHQSTDTFGDDFEAELSANPTASKQPIPSADFDDAFDEFSAVDAAPKTASGAPAIDLHQPVQTGIANAEPEDDVTPAIEREDSLSAVDQLAGPPKYSADDESSADEEEDDGPEDLDAQRLPANAISQNRNGGSALSPATKRLSLASSVDHYEDAQQLPAENNAPAAIPFGYSNAPLGGPHSPSDSLKSVPAVPGSQAPSTARDEFADFDQEFVNLSPTTATAPTNKSQSVGAFDDDFSMDDFDSAFGSSTSARRPVHEPSFDDDFNEAFSPTFTAPLPTPAAADDIAGVKTICSMGFSRGAAIEALENNDYDVNKALNTLLAKA